MIDPWGGSYYVERLTYDLARRAWAHIEEVEKAGGMAQAIDAGIPKLRIEEAAARTQARIDSGRQPVIGVNKYVADVRRGDRRAARSTTPGCAREQLEKLRRLREERDDRAVDAALDALTDAAAAIAEGSPARRRAEPAGAGRRRGPGEGHGRRDLRRAGEGLRAPRRPDPHHLRRVRRGGRGQPGDRPGPASWSTRSPRQEGRQPRILVAKMGQDGHDRGQKVIATAFADLGFDVDVGPLFQTPAEVARQAVEADVHIVGVNSLAAGHLTLVPALRAELAALGPRRTS